MQSQNKSNNSQYNQIPNTKPTRISAPYINGTSEKLNRILKPYNIQLASKPSTTLKSKLCNLKDKRSTMEKKNIVYEVPCKQCPGRYVGETGRQLETRIHEHKNAVNKKHQNSLLYQHSDNTGHNIDFGNVKVLDSAKNLGQRMLLESIHTIQLPDTMNRFKEIPEIYGSIIKKYYKKS